MLDALEQILKTNIVRRVQQYPWAGLIYLRVFLVGQRKPTWDGPRTRAALALIEEALEANRRREL